ncbi:EAL domain-containing protein [Paenarthrobacter sp. DKR-5]|uniref:putative bifunctional diguanylate cyclase/phosphodiesterase n=1 Tax=Paenarthrobacter sp. DKR-5 TaxID=2835535 RepID=UPI001BDC88A2|nr:EAL domain-containing protein [Paenarthrobacter sp. DKR-5]MBT1003246.1 EAL domain-containing protein [Paenarthrobacter sp. DKR-5]
MSGPEDGAQISDPRLDELVDAVVRLSAGDLTVRVGSSPARDAIDAVITGVNLLAEELHDVYQGLEQRVEQRTAELTRAQEELRRMALTDGLTGLANRTQLSNMIEEATARAAEGGDPPSLILLDLDAFKTINDVRGHSAGDDVLREVGARLQAAVRAGDTVARLGGDEFAVLVCDAVPDHAVVVAHRILAALEPPIRLGDASMQVEASIGVRLGGGATPGGEPPTPEVLLRDADTAMYAAKNRSKGNVRVFEMRMLSAARERAQLAEDLRRAIGGQGLELRYQPVVELGSGRIISAEALVRWPHPDRGVIPAAKFIPLAEETGLIVELGAWVLRESLAQLARWTEQGLPDDFQLRVNLSALELRQPDLPGSLSAALAGHGLAPERLVLEVTETVLMTGDSVAGENLQTLSRHGIGIDIDDFGTGYSSISYLRELPVRNVKLDKSLIAEVAGDPSQLDFVAAILQLVSSAGLEAVIEGVETGAQADLLLGLGCRQAQGFYFSAALPAGELHGLLARGTLY